MFSPARRRAHALHFLRPDLILRNRLPKLLRAVWEQLDVLTHDAVAIWTAKGWPVGGDSTARPGDRQTHADRREQNSRGHGKASFRLGMEF